MPGTALAQAIPRALSPILTRLNTPQDFGILAINLSIAALGAAVVSLKYDLAISATGLVALVRYPDTVKVKSPSIGLFLLHAVYR